jgi:hypothetical protein
MLLGLRRLRPCAMVVSMSSRLDQSTRPLHARVVPADALLHPVAALAVIILVLNDHVGKAMWPGTVTGKLSDVAGLVFFPLVLVGLWEVGLSGLRRWEHSSTSPVVVGAIATGLAFILVKTTTVGAGAWAGALGLGQWIVGMIGATLAGFPSPDPVAVVVVRDATDLVALPAILVAVWIGVKRARSETRSRSEPQRPREWAAR